MPQVSTLWTLICAAQDGRSDAREALAATYLPFVRAYLRARWAGTARARDVEDAVQDVFVDLLRDGGALARLVPRRPGGFRAFLCGVTRNVALRAERPSKRPTAVAPAALDGVPSEQDSAARLVDREWARTLLREAARRMREAAARAKGPAARRAELLRLRFEKGLEIREIAAEWGVDASKVHHLYADARTEYLRHLEDVVGDHEAGTLRQRRRRCEELIGMIA